MVTVSELARQHQADHPVFGVAFRALYEYTRRMASEHYEEDLPIPVYHFDPLYGKRRAFYVPNTSTGLEHVITIDPFKCRTLVDVAELATHEYAHLWQVYVGEGEVEHALDWRVKMTQFGIIADARGHHLHRTTDWDEWLAANDDLGLEMIVFNEEAPLVSELHVYTCPICGTEVEGATPGLMLVCQQEACDTPMSCSS